MPVLRASDGIRSIRVSGSPFLGLGLRLLVASIVALGLLSPGEAAPDPDHWSFQDLHTYTLPDNGEPNPIDAFVLKRLKSKGLTISKPAPPAVLLRRLSLDLTGLPPNPRDQARFQTGWAADPKQASADLIDRLLASPRYGERWAQHWLDAVRYADTHGFEVNTPRPNAWPYRDYVIRAFNEDLPYDRFIFEQLAGDTTGVDAATGFLVTAAALLPGQVGKDEESIRRARQDELNEILVNTATTFLGLTVHCARCHNHKFDSITQRDYYQLQAIFGGVHYGERPMRDEEKDRNSKLVALQGQIEQAENALLALGLRPPVNARHNIERFPATTIRYLRFTILDTNGAEPCIDELEAWSVPHNGGSPSNVALASEGTAASSSGDYHDPINHKLSHINDGNYGNSRSWIAKQLRNGWVELDFGKPILIDKVTWGRDHEEHYKDRLAIKYRIEGAKEPGQWTTITSSKDRLSSLDPAGLDAPRALAITHYQKLLRDRDRFSQKSLIFGGIFGQPPIAHLLHLGDPSQEREEVRPDTPAIFGSLGLSDKSSGPARRVALARWISSPQNPLTARVLVNRIWHAHFGVGLVDTPSDFGAMGGRPSHPKLLDWLADHFMENDWSIKKLHRLIVSSRIYQQASHPRQAPQAQDADNRLLWRFRPRRLEAEAIRDSILQITGSLDLSMGGPGFSFFKANTNYVRVYTPKENFGPAEWRRMIYAHRVRMEQDGVFGAFDRPDAGLICARRQQSTTPLQALNLFNSRFIQTQSTLFARRLEKDGGERLEKRIDLAYRLCFCRPAEPEEQGTARDFITEHGLAQFCRVLLNSNEFLFLP